MKRNKAPDMPFVNEVRLSPRHWAMVIGILAFVVTLTPSLWKILERFDTGLDYRIPYALSKDYWLYEHRLQRLARTNIVVLGDSVVWGEYVLADGTLSHFLNREAGTTNLFVNGGVNGLFPLALEGLIGCYGGPLSHQKVILHCNVLWMTSPKADLSADKEEPFNHAALVPQFSPRIPCYRADANERLNAIMERNVPFLEWVNHLQSAYFGQQIILKWTLAEEGGDPPRYPNAYRNPFSQITLAVPPEPQEDPQRGPQRSRHKAWSTNSTGTTRFDWVGVDQSLQWHAFQRLIATVRVRGNDVLVVLGPFNEHIMAEENRPAYRKVRDDILLWLSNNQIPHLAPDPLPSAFYADASHPLTEGYQLLAKRLFTDATFRNWLSAK
ncbi:MAG: SGNH/GDSL hydrolase family protein [Pedosphaera sp.]|nr:SGNH/GDSL hydrolase family protein [Pedosphaera sp.]